jgi:hypothetical protein
MAEFLVSKELSVKIREVLRGENRRCAVAFWGKGSAAFLKSSSSGDTRDAKIVCDLSMGATDPNELKNLGAPNNKNLRYYPKQLHAKVYISDIGAVVASANASNNGIGFNAADEPEHLEAGTFYARSHVQWNVISSWFDGIFEKATKIDKKALEDAKKKWEPRPELDMFKDTYPEGSLLGMVRKNPELFEGIGFIFCNSPLSAKEIEGARKDITKDHPENTDKIYKWPRKHIYKDWPKECIQRWPNLFFDFYKPGKKLKIGGRETAMRNKEKTTVFVREAFQDIKLKIKGLPNIASIELSDADIVKNIFGNEKTVFFATAEELQKRLIEIDNNSKP